MGSSLEAPVNDGGIQKLDNVHGHSSHVTRCHPVLNLKVRKLNYCLGNLTPDCAVPKMGRTFLEVCKNIFSQNVCRENISSLIYVECYNVSMNGLRSSIQ